MKVELKYLCLLLTCATAVAATKTTIISSGSTEAKAPDCDRACGNVQVPYPFGIDDPNCAKDDKYFFITCNRSYTPPILFLLPNIQVVSISVQEGTVSVRIDNAVRCYNESGLVGKFDQNIRLGADSPFTFSNTVNKFVALGCDTLARMRDSQGRFGSGCFSLCNAPVNLTKEGSCSGFGCCQTLVPKNLKTLKIMLASPSNHTNTWEFNPCDFAFVVDHRSFDISKMRLDFRPPELENSSLLLDWVVDNKTCDEARMNVAGSSSSYACGQNTDCSYSDNALGYRCHCSKGFRGNPYDLQQGCQGTIPGPGPWQGAE